MDALIDIDLQKGKQAAELLHNCFSTSGILGKTEMPEDILPAGMKYRSVGHLLFITLTVSIDYQRDANTLWAVSRKTWESPGTKYLFHLKSLHETQPRKIAEDMKKFGLSKKYKKDPDIWRTVGITFYKKWDGNPVNFLRDCGWDAIELLKRLKSDTHLYNGKPVPDYPYLRGDKIGPLWLRMLRDNVGIEKLRKLEKVPIPVDIHIARATLSMGIVRGKFDGRLSDLFEHIRSAWFESVDGLNVKNRKMMALDVDEPLWHLSKYGCAKRDKATGLCPVKDRCEAQAFCIQGTIKIENGKVELDT